MKHVLSLVLLCAVGLLSGCATSNVDTSYRPDNQSGYGLLVGSITYDGFNSGYEIYYRNSANDDIDGWIQFGAGTIFSPGFYDHNDFSYLDDTDGKLFVVKLPAGKYSISKWAVDSGAASIQPQEDFAVDYQIKPGVVTYVGDFNFHQSHTEGLMLTGVKVDDQDRFARDMALFRKEYSNAGDMPVNRAIAMGTVIKNLGSGSSAVISPILP